MEMRSQMALPSVRRMEWTMQWSTALLLFPLLLILATVEYGEGGGSDRQKMIISGTREYCQLESFQAACNPQREVVVMETAIYGRMRIGRCVRFNYGYIGCLTDVLAQMDRLCSGRRFCEVPVSVLHGSHPCPEDLTPYLEVSYQCLTVINSEDYTCTAHAPVVVTSPSGYLPSIVTTETGLGGRECPWRIQVRPYQVINVTLFNFARIGPIDEWGSFSPIRPRICYQLATIREKQFARVVTECEGSAHTSHVYTSLYDVIDVDVTVTKTTDFFFLFFYEAIPCFQSSGKSAMRQNIPLRCNASDYSTRQQGDCFQSYSNGVSQDNCTTPVSSRNNSDGYAEAFPFTLLLIVSLGVAFGVFVGGFLLACGTKFAKKKRSQTWPTTFLFDHRSVQASAERTLVVASEGSCHLGFPSLLSPQAPTRGPCRVEDQPTSGSQDRHVICHCGSTSCRSHNLKWTPNTGWT